MAPALARYEREAWTPTDTGLCAMPMIQPADDDFRICQISFKTLLDIQLEAERLGLATRWSSADALRSQVREDAVVLQSLMREERQGAVRSYRCLVLFAMAGGSASGGLATIDVAPARYESLQRLDQEPEVSQAFFRLFTLATGGISMVCKL
jgi:hypothetical protein